ncbi:MAG: hypothetical protein GW949_10805 [Spirochaetales bacterium]|nr:hypothetical protein [Spirochaetales bacterium]
MTIQLFVDLDGVLADFDSRVKEITGRLPAELPPPVMWSRIAKTPDFYASLNWMADGETLWNLVARFNPVILTGLPRGTWAEGQKRAWCAKHLGKEVKVITCMSKQKAEKAWEFTGGEGMHILIDDRESLKDSWEDRGGVFILHRSTEESLTALRSLGLDL